ncbi:hypothetical protein SFC43_01775 [Bacteroides sp. CR5/BHMF/2]|nr:hypothetical protein [Bacteroides sp. CR5/BHMF/2]
MIEKNEFPFSLGGYGWQEEYKGFDIVVHVQKHKGISAYAFSSENVSFGKNQKLLEIKKNYSNGDVVPLTDIYNSKRRD